ncbi:MAG: hypothetical protein QW594_02930 [Candidatus Woesearchaeota archaeon]
MKEVMKDKTSTLGKWAFVVGLVIAILTGFLEIIWFPAVLFFMGLAVGFFNVSEKEVPLYLAAVVTMIVSSFSLNTLSVMLGASGTQIVTSILSNFNAFVAASGLVVAIKTVIKLGRSG